MANLWDVEHDYYCLDGNYYNGEVGEFDNWEDFEESFPINSSWDITLNLIFRWDWEELSDDDDKPTGKYVLKLHMMKQRLGLYVTFIVKVNKKDQKKIKKYLRQHWNYIKELWEPLS